MIHDSNEIYRYTEFNNDHWQYNVNKIFTLIFLAFGLTTVKLMINDYDVSTGTLIMYLITSPLDVLFGIALIEAICALVVKVGLNPGLLLETKLLILPKIIVKTIFESYSSFYTFKQVNYTRTVRTSKRVLHGSVACDGREIDKSEYRLLYETILTNSTVNNNYIVTPNHFK